MIVKETNYFCSYMKSFKKTFFIVLLFCGLVMLSQGCIFGKKGGSTIRKAEKMEKQMEKESRKEEKAILKAQEEMQSDMAKQMMKDMKKQQKKANKIRERSIWDRLFRKKCK